MSHSGSGFLIHCPSTSTRSFSLVTILVFIYLSLCKCIANRVGLARLEATDSEYVRLTFSFSQKRSVLENRDVCVQLVVEPICSLKNKVAIVVLLECNTYTTKRAYICNSLIQYISLWLRK